LIYIPLGEAWQQRRSSPSDLVIFEGARGGPLRAGVLCHVPRGLHCLCLAPDPAQAVRFVFKWQTPVSSL
jgi:hypothetical protein